MNELRIHCTKVINFWRYWINSWENISDVKLKNDPSLEESIVFGW